MARSYGSVSEASLNPLKNPLENLVSRLLRSVAQREAPTEELAAHLRACRTKIREGQEHDRVDKKSAKRMISGIEELEAALLKERAALARNRAKLEFGILSHPTHARISEAYLASLVENLSEPAGARLKKQRSRDHYDQNQFKKPVRQAYTPTPGSTQYDPPMRGSPDALVSSYPSVARRCSEYNSGTYCAIWSWRI